MKTVEQLAKEYQNEYGGNHSDVDFIAGYKKAKEWISVDYGFPEPEKECVIMFDSEELRPQTALYNNKVWIHCGDIKSIVTKWRYID